MNWYHRQRIEDGISDAMNQIGEPESRFEALVKTKLEEALLWLSKVEEDLD